MKIQTINNLSSNDPYITKDEMDNILDLIFEIEFNTKYLDRYNEINWPYLKIFLIRMTTEPWIGIDLKNLKKIQHKRIQNFRKAIRIAYFPLRFVNCVIDCKFEDFSKNFDFKKLGLNMDLEMETFILSITGITISEFINRSNKFIDSIFSSNRDKSNAELLKIYTNSNNLSCINICLNNYINGVQPLVVRKLITKSINNQISRFKDFEKTTIDALTHYQWAESKDTIKSIFSTHYNFFNYELPIPSVNQIVK